MKDLLSIGEMARLNKISIQRLRYYDNIGLYSPVYIDPNTHYRYYSLKQKKALDIIQALQYMGLTLSEIASIKENGQEVIILDALIRSRQAIVLQQQKIARKKKIVDHYLDRLQWIRQHKRNEWSKVNISARPIYIIARNDFNIVLASEEEITTIYDDTLDVCFEKNISRGNIKFLGFVIHPEQNYIYLEVEEPLVSSELSRLEGGTFLQTYCFKHELESIINQIQNEQPKTHIIIEIFNYLDLNKEAPLYFVRVKDTTKSIGEINKNC